ncbi:hypothetical protein BDR26DRAFT_1007601 [Obelidium mucronatum]|nr:hypothetical protein BDR26DRAFT_1007601 [Obelidium mucronatum]
MSESETTYALFLIHRQLYAFTDLESLLHLFSTCSYLLQARLFAFSKCNLSIRPLASVESVTDLFGPLLPFIRSISFTHPEPNSDLSMSLLPHLSTSLQALTLNSGYPPDLTLVTTRFRSLVSLDLKYSKMTDISALSVLTRLEDLNLHRSKVRDFKPITGLTFLKTLDLSSTCVKNKDLTCLYWLSRLLVLRINNTHISDISILKRNRGLKKLNLGHTLVADATALSELSNLESLTVCNSHVAKVDWLVGLVRLKVLDVSHCPRVIDISVLSQLKKLEKLDVSFTSISGLDPLKYLKKLVNLDISRCIMLRDLRPLSDLTELKVLKMVGNDGIGNINALKGLMKLEELEYDEHNVGTGKGCLKGLRKLRLVNNEKRA